MLTLRIDVDGLLACDGVGSDDGVLVDHGLAADDAAPQGRSISLLVGRVGGLEAVKTLLEGRRETVVGLGGVDEEGIAARFGLVENVQEGGSRRLGLVRDVGVPSYGRGAVGEELVD